MKKGPFELAPHLYRRLAKQANYQYAHKRILLSRASQKKKDLTCAKPSFRMVLITQNHE